MTKWFTSLLFLSTSISTTFAWGSANYTPPSIQPVPGPTLAEISFPVNPDQGWFVKPTLLVWRPYQDDLDTGFSQATVSTSPTILKDKTQNVHFEWGVGARVAVGRYLPNHDQWDVTLTSTFFYSDTDQTVKGKSGAGSTPIVAITNGWNPSLLGTSLKTDLNWRINYFTWDLATGRLFQLTRKLVLHPYICLRAVLLYETYGNKNNALAINSQSATEIRKTTFRTHNSVWGLGPRLGSDFTFNFGRHWSLLGGLSGAVVMGRYHIGENIRGFIADGNAPSTPASLSIHDADSVMRANLEGNIGLGWEKWVNKHSVRIAPSFLFEVTQWFLINNWVATNLPASPAPGNPDWGMLSTRRMGDLGFLGFTVNLQVDF